MLHEVFCLGVIRGQQRAAISVVAIYIYIYSFASRYPDYMRELRSRLHANITNKS